jgi:hypothetical protein
MRYSNVHESFFDFLKDKKQKEYKKTLERIQVFLNNNKQYGYEVNTGLPGLCPLEKLAQAIVTTEKYIKKVIKELNIENLKVIKINSKVWSGDVLVILPSEKIGKGYSKSSSDYNINTFSDYIEDFGYSGYRTKRKKRTSRYMYESIFSDFMSYLKSDKEISTPEYNIDNAYVQVTRFLVKYPYFDYDKTTDTPGMIFLSSLSQNIQVPFNALKKLIKSNKFENVDIVDISVEGIEGPVLIVGNPPYDRKELLSSWKKEIEEIPQEEKEEIIDASKSMEDEILSGVPQQNQQKSEPSAEEKTISEPKVEKGYEISDKENVDRKTLIVEETTNAINATLSLESVKGKTPIQTKLYSIFNKVSSGTQRKQIISSFISIMLDDIMVGKYKTISPESLEKKIFIKSKMVDGLYYFMDGTNNEGLKLATIINENPEILNSFYSFVKDSLASEMPSDIESENTPSENTEEPQNEIDMFIASEKEKAPKTESERLVNSSQFYQELYNQIKDIESVIKNPDKTQSKLIGVIKNSSKSKIIQANQEMIYDLINSTDSYFRDELNNRSFIIYDKNPSNYFFISNKNKAVEEYLKLVVDKYADYLLKLLQK